MKFKSLIFHIGISFLVFIVGACVYHKFFTRKLIISDKTDQHILPVSLVADLRMNASVSPNDFVKVIERTRAAVVYIKAYKKLQGAVFESNYSREKGSGVLISSEGMIVTNYHVVAEADYIEVTLDDKREYLAELLGKDEDTDLAVLKIEGKGLHYFELGDSDSLHVGEWVLAIGNPFGLQSTVTCGIVSAKARSLENPDKNNLESYIQTDAVINPGSSGGALCNVHGELMGISSAILSTTGNYEGISFAIPANIVGKIATDIIEFGSVQRGRLGITVRDVDSETARRAGLKSIRGVIVTSVQYQSAADNAGIKRGDVLIALGNKEIDSRSDFFESINQYRPGDKISLGYSRDGKRLSSSVILTNYLNSTEMLISPQDKILRDIGLELRDLSKNEKNRIKTNGVLVVSISKASIVYKTNMEPGYIIESVNGKVVNGSNDVVNYLQNSADSVVFRGFYERYPGEFPYAFSLKNDP